MSKAFDTVNGRIPFQHLEEVLNKDEMHIMCMLTNKLEITVKIGSHNEECFVTFTMIIQGIF